jgi:hypothetical protein
MATTFNWEEFDVISVDRSASHKETLLEWCREMATDLGIQRALFDEADAGFDDRAKALMAQSYVQGTPRRKRNPDGFRDYAGDYAPSPVVHRPMPTSQHGRRGSKKGAKIA